MQIARKKRINKLINESIEIILNIALISKNIALSTDSSRKRNKDFNFIVKNNKDFAFINIDRNTRFKANKLSSINYKKFHNSEKQLKETINYLNDLYNVKHIFNLYNYMQRTLNALKTKKNFKLKYISESLIYKQAINLSF